MAKDNQVDPLKFQLLALVFMLALKYRHCCEWANWKFSREENASPQNVCIQVDTLQQHLILSWPSFFLGTF